MAAGITIRGLDEINRKLRRLPAALGRKIVRKSLRLALKPVAAKVKALEPQGETGTLKRAAKVLSGRSRKGRISMRLVIGANAFKGGRFYGAFRDLGTGKLAGSGAMGEAFNETAEQAKAEAERLILEGVMNELK